jgi:hypothetical protein
VTAEATVPPTPAEVAESTNFGLLPWLSWQPWVYQAPFLTFFLALYVASSWGGIRRLFVNGALVSVVSRSPAHKNVSVSLFGTLTRAFDEPILQDRGANTASG